MKSIHVIYLLYSFNVFPFILTYYIYEDQRITNNAINGEINNAINTFFKSSSTSAFKKKYYSGTISAKYRKPVSDDLMDSRFQVKPLSHLQLRVDSVKDKPEADYTKSEDTTVPKPQAVKNTSSSQLKDFFPESKATRKVIRKTEDAKHGSILAYQRVKPAEGNNFIIRKLPLHNYFISGHDKTFNPHQEDFQVSENAKIVKSNADQIYVHGVVAKRVQNFYQKPNYVNYRNGLPKDSILSNWNTRTQVINKVRNDIKTVPDKNLRNKEVRKSEHCLNAQAFLSQSDSSNDNYKRNARQDNRRLFYGKSPDVLSLKSDSNAVRQNNNDVKKSESTYTLFEAPEQDQVPKQYMQINKHEDLIVGNDKQKWFKGFRNEVGLNKGKLRVKNFSNYRKL